MSRRTPGLIGSERHHNVRALSVATTLRPVAALSTTLNMRCLTPVPGARLAARGVSGRAGIGAGFGIAFGVDQKKQALSDILLAKQIRLCDVQRVGTEIIPGRDRVHSSTCLPNFFSGFPRTSWPGTPVRLVLGADKLVDKIDHREQIEQLEPKAIGGEMEGAGYTWRARMRTWIGS